MTATEGVPAAAKPGGQPAAVAAGRSWMEMQQVHSSYRDAAAAAAACAARCDWLQHESHCVPLFRGH